MSKDEAWEECLSAFRSVCQDRCVNFDCDCEEFFQQVKEAIYV